MLYTRASKRFSAKSSCMERHVVMQSKQEKWYRLYGLLVRSQLHLPEVALEAPDGTPDVEVRFGALEPYVLAALKEGRAKKCWVGKLEDGTIWMDSLYACYQVRYGRERAC